MRKGKRRVRNREVSPSLAWRILRFTLKSLFAFFVGGLLLNAFGIFELRPKLSASPQVTLEPPNPFSTAFVVKNESSIFPLRDLRTGCDGSAVMVATKTQVVRPKVEIGMGRLEHLPLRQSFTTYCRVNLGLAPELEQNISGLEITLKIAYSAPFIPFRLHDEYPFSYAVAKDGQLHWLPPMDK
jgi:hypothetical protein